MILLLDIGNSRVKWAELECGELGDMRARSHCVHDCPGTISQIVSELQKPARIFAASVLPKLVEESIAERVRSDHEIDIEYVRAQAAGFGIRSGYLQPDRLGVDRYVALVATHALYQTDCLVIDCGTAVTVDALQKDGRHLGGLISPGLQVMQQSLVQRTALITSFSDSEDALFGVDTDQAVRNGCRRFLAAAIDGVCREMADRLGPDTQRILCGGDVSLVAPLLSGRYDIRPDLVLRGLAVIATS